MATLHPSFEISPAGVGANVGSQLCDSKARLLEEIEALDQQVDNNALSPDG